MTNAQILSEKRWSLKRVEAALKSVQRMAPTPVNIAKGMRLAELRENLQISIADLEGAIAAGADNETPLAGWC